MNERHRGEYPFVQELKQALDFGRGLFPEFGEVVESCFPVPLLLGETGFNRTSRVLQYEVGTSRLRLRNSDRRSLGRRLMTVGAVRIAQPRPRWRRDSLGAERAATIREAVAIVPISLLHPGRIIALLVPTLSAK